MKHSEILKKTREVLGEELFGKAIKINRGSSSGCNYINLLFDNEVDREIAKGKLGNPSNCEKRYGLGLIITQYRI
jgi:hypothetical protein